MWKKFLETLKKKSLSEQVLDKSINSIKQVKDMFLNAKYALRNKGNLELAKRVLEEDRMVNKSERSVRRKLLTHFALSDKFDIGTGFAISSIVIDFERIGDYAKNIADLALLMDDHFTCDVYDDRVKSIEQKIEKIFDKTITSFAGKDDKLAREVTEIYKNEISRECSIIKDSLIREEEKISSGTAVAIALYLRYLKRIGAHLYNISTSVLNPFPRIGYKEKGTE